MVKAIHQGMRIPDAQVAELVQGEVVSIRTERLLQGRRVLIVGVPGAFTPVCTSRHLPEFVARADLLLRSGFSELICIAPNDPWTVEAWARTVDPKGAIRFLSDGNLELVRAMGLTVREPQYFLGERSRRYVMAVKDAVVEKLSVEATIFDVTCTRATEVLLAA